MEKKELKKVLKQAGYYEFVREIRPPFGLATIHYHGLDTFLKNITPKRTDTPSRTKRQ